MRSLMVLTLCALCATPAFAEKKKGGDKAPADNYDVLLQQFLQEARASATSQGGAVSNSSWMAGLTSDLRARHKNDHRHRP